MKTPYFPRVVFVVTLFFSIAVHGKYPAAASIESISVSVSDSYIKVYKWEKLPSPIGFTDSFDSDLIVDPSDERVIYFKSNYNIVSKSTDAGNSWDLISGLLSSPILSIGSSAAIPQRIYATSANTLYRSEDGGKTWVNFPLPIAMPCNNSLIAAPSNPDRLYLVKCMLTEGPYFYRSNNGGVTWEIPPLPQNSYNSLTALALSPVNPDLIIAGERIGDTSGNIIISINGGQSWNDTGIKTSVTSVMFDPGNPHSVYVNSGTDLLRSVDDRISWQEGLINNYIATFIFSPFSEGEVLLGGGDDSWIMFPGISDWQATTWDSPIPLRKLIRSENSKNYIYAFTDNEIWRCGLQVLISNKIFLPVISNSQTPFPESSLRALERMNSYRSIMNLPALKLDRSINLAAQNHANYYMLNVNDRSAWDGKDGVGFHSEIWGKPGFTGTIPSARMVAAGYRGIGFGEVMHFIGDPQESVDGWMATVYHRIMFIDPDTHYVGYGYAKDSTKAVDVVDSALSSGSEGKWFTAHPYFVTYPVDGQTNVPTSWNGAEWPNPLPPGASTPVGYPFTVMLVNGVSQEINIEMRSENGTVIPIHPNPYSGQTMYVLIPIHPLNPNTTYSVRAKATINNNKLYDGIWSFKTAP